MNHRAHRLDISRIAPKLYQGSVPMIWHPYSEFSMLVLCAIECQPELPLFNGQILRAAFDDTTTPTGSDLQRATKAAEIVATELRRGGRVLVTCHAGLNRSGLVVGLALGHVTQMSGDLIVRVIRDGRCEDALGNETFEAMVRGFADSRRQNAACFPDR